MKKNKLILVLFVFLLSIGFFSYTKECRNFYRKYGEIQLGASRLHVESVLKFEPLGSVVLQNYVVCYYKSPCFVSRRLLLTNPVNFEKLNSEKKLLDVYGVVEVFYSKDSEVEAFRMYGEFSLSSKDGFELP